MAPGRGQVLGWAGGVCGRLAAIMVVNR
jgi:hypothetical protein